MKTSNPVLSRLGQAAAAQRAAGYAPAGAYGAGYGQPYPTTDGYAPPTVRPMTIDDVVVRTVGLLALTGLSAVFAWVAVPDSAIGGAAFGAAMVGLVVGLVISFRQVTNPFVIGAYALIEGVFVGGISKIFETAYNGIVLQAAVATFGIFLLMTILYKIKAIRATPRFVRGVMAAMIGVFAVIMINLVLSLFGVNTGLRDGSPMAIGFSLVVIVIASLSFILNFHEIEQGVRYGLPERYAWTCAFGLLVGLIWVYLEILRLLSYLQGRD